MIHPEKRFFLQVNTIRFEAVSMAAGPNFDINPPLPNINSVPTFIVRLT